jgi:hypothetical protein
MAALTKAAS